jgi:hypothetical protein
MIPTQKIVSAFALTLALMLLNADTTATAQITGARQNLNLHDGLNLPFGFGASPAFDDIKVSAPVTVTTNGMPEATVAVIPPKKFQRCLDGRLLFGSGTIVRSLSLTPATGHAPFSHNFFPEIQSPQDLTTPHVIYDNHLIASGDNLFYTVEAVIWRDNITPHPSWWNDTKVNTLKGKNVPGGRSAIFVFKSNTCGETWTPYDIVDAAKLVVRNPAAKKLEAGYCGVPRVDSVNHKAEAGGWDGHYVYQDFMPAGFVLITTGCTTGKGADQGLLLSKAGAGGTWTVLRQYDNPDTFWRIPAAMLSNQTVGIVYKQGANLILEAARFPFTLGDFKTIAKYPVSYPAIGFDSVGLKASMYGYFSLVNTTIVDKATFKTREGFQVAAYVNDNNTAAYSLYFQTPEVSASAPKPFSTIRAATKGNNVLQGTLVQSAVPGMSSIFYWIEQVSKGQFQIRFQAYSQNFALGTPKTVSTTFAAPTFTGDYLGGTSYRESDGTHFFLSWSETNTLKYVEVTVPPSLSL